MTCDLDFDVIQDMISGRIEVNIDQPVVKVLESIIDIDTLDSSTKKSTPMLIGALCQICGGNLKKQITTVDSQDINNTVCSDCGVVSMSTSDSDMKASDANLKTGTYRLRVIGANSKIDQANLYKDTSLPACKIYTRESVLSEYIKILNQYNENVIAQKDKMPLDPCRLAADIYSSIQEVCVKRSENRKNIMAECYRLACLLFGYVPDKASLSKAMGLRSGPAKGANFVMAVLSANVIDSYVISSINYVNAFVETIFKCMNITNDDYIKDLRTKIVYMVKVLDVEKVAYTAQRKTKACGMTYNVIKRFIKNKYISDKTGVDSSQKIFAELTLVEFVHKLPSNYIMIGTIVNFLQTIISYHSKFEKHYQELELDDSKTILEFDCNSKLTK